jgi:hypothetical protein
MNKKILTDMKNTVRIPLTIALVALLSFNLSAEWVKNPHANPQPQAQPSGKRISAGCVPATSSTELKINNVRARINTGGDMWWDLQGNPVYEIPRGSQKHSMFSASLWIGGVDVNGQLKLAALRYRQVGNDFWPGPLTIDNTAAIDPETCAEYDKHFPMTRAEVNEFIANQLFPDPNYVIPRSILDWPAHGDVTKNQSYYLAPFFDADGDGNYDPYAGDYPYYDINNSLCPTLPQNKFKPPVPTKETEIGITHGGILSDQVLKGDETLWWVFNDKGNAHTETQGEPIGLEIRAQAFGFATNDEINNMTFYSYEIINRSTYRLTETYFSQWVDTDVGYAYDDYVGCDVQRGLGYCYNGKAQDGSGKFDHYGDQPPAIGVDFFQGPYMDPDGIDNPKYDALGNQICDVSINGVNFGDTIVDNERFGMRRFVYHNNTGGGGLWAMQDPQIAIEYYRLLRGIWKDGVHMQYGGNAHPNSTPPAYGPASDFMFPDLTDPCNWGTGGVPPNGPKKWTEQSANNLPYDRRFMQSAGPFTLEPGAVNYITVGIPWARAATGGPFASVELLRQVDDKCQRLFDNCFKVVDGPDAPDLVIQEMDRTLLLYVSNRRISNNYNEGYVEWDPGIISPDSLPFTQPGGTIIPRYDSLYRFEGYKIYQVRDASVSISEVKDPDKARLVAQCDVKNGVTQLVNYYFSDQVQGNIPVEEVNGFDEGVRHSFKITEDFFASGDRRLVNHKKYYYIAIAYAYNNYKKYSQDPGVLDGLHGQKQPYLAGRKTAVGTAITSVTAIPHNPSPEKGGTEPQAEYGDGVKIKRIEGHGNGGNLLRLTQSSVDKIMSGPPWNNLTPEYENGLGPIDVKVIDPLNVKKADYVLKFQSGGSLDTARWILIDLTDNDTIFSERTISVANEQLLLDRGLAITIGQSLAPGTPPGDEDVGLLDATMTFADSSKRWLSGVPDIDASPSLNWIRSGSREDASEPKNNDYIYLVPGSNPPVTMPYDPKEYFEKLIGGTWAPYFMVSRFDDPPYTGLQYFNLTMNTFMNLNKLYSVDVVFTNDKSKWTRCPVIELGKEQALNEGAAVKYQLRKGQSVNKEGQPDGTGTGMGWFPGYAINVETGERLNMMFGENSWLIGQNGRDMKWNPTDEYFTPLGEALLGGFHAVYVFGHHINGNDHSPAYDEGQWAYNKLTNASNFALRDVYKDVMWVNFPMLAGNSSLLETDATVRIRVKRPYANNYWTTSGAATPQNNNQPMYSFNTNDVYTKVGVKEVAESALDIIRVVPNPYYAYSAYETNQLDNRVKVTNLPEKCTISIYSIDGTLIRQYTKDDPTTSIEWDLKNSAGIPISGGVYLLHINAPGIGEKIVKWFGTLRPLDLNSF